VVLLLLLGNVGMVAMLMIAAGPIASRRVVPDYYQRAASYDAEIAQRATNRRLGLVPHVSATTSRWQVTIAGASDAVGGVGGVGAVDAAKVSLGVRHRTQASLDRAVSLTAVAGGYEAGLALPAGIYDVDITIETAAGKFVDHQEVEIKP